MSTETTAPGGERVADEQTFHRPPRRWPTPVPAEKLRVPAPPTLQPPPQMGLIQMLFPVVGSVGIFGFALIYGNTAFLYIAIAMITLLVLFSFAMRWSQKREHRKRQQRESARYRDYLKGVDAELAEAGRIQHEALERLYPAPSRLWTRVVKRDGVWERRLTDPDAVRVRLGTGTVELQRPVELDMGMNPTAEYDEDVLAEAKKTTNYRKRLPKEPVVVDLDELGVVAVTGPRPRTVGLARTVLLQLAAHRAPGDLHVVIAPEDPEAWSWAGAMPHLKASQTGDELRRGGPPRPAVARDTDDLEALLAVELEPRIEQLRRLEEAHPNAPNRPQLAAAELFVIVEGFSPEHPARDRTRFRELQRRARELRCVLILLCDAADLAPEHVDARLEVPERGKATWIIQGPDAPIIEEIDVDDVDPGVARAIVDSLAPLRLRGGDGGDRSLADEVRLLDVLPRDDDPLRVPLGVDTTDATITLDLRQAAEGGMGPHGILIGATGSGKSELLKSVIAGLADTHSPDRLSFVLVDFKGGAAFADLERLPHVAGLITNLQRDLSLVDRMRDALVGEQERRQAMLRDAGNLDDVRAYRQARERDPSLAPLPDLLIVVDEFSEMLQVRPEFLDVFVGLGRVGRSLGMHLMLSSQRLDEGRMRGLESHLRYRICLRTYSANESKLVIGTPDAYLLPSIPGVGYLKVDTGALQQFRGAIVSSRSPHRVPAASGTPDVSAGVPTAERDDRPAPTVPIDTEATGVGDGSLEGDSTGGRSWAAPDAVGWEAGDAGDGPADAVGEVALVGGRRERTDLDDMLDRVIADSGSSEPVHAVWVPPLPEHLTLDGAGAITPFWERELPPPRLTVGVGRIDLPDEQRTAPLDIDLTGKGGNVVVVGAPLTGKSTALRTLALGLARTYTPDEVRVYGIDLGGGLLAGLKGLPHVGGVAVRTEKEAVERLVLQLQSEIEEREALLGRLGLGSIAEVREMRARGELPAEAAGRLADVFLLVDGWGAFREDFEASEKAVQGIAAGGLGVGLHVAVTATRWAEIRPALLDNLGYRLELKLNDPLDSDVGRRPQEGVPEGIAGRGILGDERHFQIALPRTDGVESDAGVGDALRAAVEDVAGRWHGQEAEPIRLLPRQVAPGTLPEPTRQAVPVGLEERRMSVATVNPLYGPDPHLLVYGDASCGKSTLLRLLVEGIARTHEPEELAVHVVDTRRSLTALAGLPHLVTYATSAPSAQAAAEKLAATLTERVPGGGEDQPVAPVTAFEGQRHLIVCDDYDLLSGPTGSPLQELVDLLPLGADVGLHVILARRVGGSSRLSYEQVIARVRELGSPGFVFSGDPMEGQVLGGVKARPMPAGRAQLVLRGEAPLTVQIAHLAAEPAGPPAGGGSAGGPGRTGDAAAEHVAEPARAPDVDPAPAVDPAPRTSDQEPPTA